MPNYPNGDGFVPEPEMSRDIYRHDQVMGPDFPEEMTWSEAAIDYITGADKKTKFILTTTIFRVLLFIGRVVPAFGSILASLGIVADDMGFMFADDPLLVVTVPMAILTVRHVLRGIKKHQKKSNAALKKERERQLGLPAQYGQQYPHPPYPTSRSGWEKPPQQ